VQAAVCLAPCRIGQGLIRVSLCNLSPEPDTGIHGGTVVCSHQRHKARACAAAQTFKMVVKAVTRAADTVVNVTESERSYKREWVDDFEFDGVSGVKSL
jgi:hypothetical protein